MRLTELSDPIHHAPQACVRIVLTLEGAKRRRNMIPASARFTESKEGRIQVKSYETVNDAI